MSYPIDSNAALTARIRLRRRARGYAVGPPDADAAYCWRMDAPLLPPEDDKDWTWVLSRPCPDCGYDPAGVDSSALAGLVADAVAPWAGVLARDDVRTRPAPQVWSPLEYACHVRDALTIFAGRVRLMLDQHEPTFPNWDQDGAAVEQRYWEQDPAAVAGEVEQAGAEFAQALARVRPADWSRPGLRSNGSRFTVESIGVYFLHDLRHHLWDVHG